MDGIFGSNAIRFLGLIDGAGEGEVRFTVRPELMSGWETAHTYVLAAMIEMAGAKVAPGNVVPSQVSFNLISAARVGEEMVAIGTILSAGKTLCITRTEIRVGERLIASGQVTFVCMRTAPTA